MGSTRGGPPLPTPNFDVDASAGTTLPFSRDPNDSAGDLLVLIKVCTPDPETNRRTQAEIRSHLEGLKVGKRGIHCLVSEENVEMSIIDQQRIASLIVPRVAKALGVPGIG